MIKFLGNFLALSTPKFFFFKFQLEFLNCFRFVDAEFFSSKIETACRNGFATSIIAHSAEMSTVQFPRCLRSFTKKMKNIPFVIINVPIRFDMIPFIFPRYTHTQTH